MGDEIIIDISSHYLLWNIKDTKKKLNNVC